MKLRKRVSRLPMMSNTYPVAKVPTMAIGRDQKTRLAETVPMFSSDTPK